MDETAEDPRDPEAVVNAFLRIRPVRAALSARGTCESCDYS
jgi:hypothetical protein